MTWIVAAPTRSGLKKVLRTMGDVPFSWAYVGRDVQGFENTKIAFENRGTLVETTVQFHEAAEEMREEYLKLIYDIGEKSNTLQWWLSALSYRSRSVSKTFPHAVYLKVSLDLFKEWPKTKPLVLIASDYTVQRALEINLDLADLPKVKFFKQRKPLYGLVGIDWGNLVLRRLFFLYREGRRMVEARMAIRKAHVPAEPTVLVICTVSMRNIHQKSDFHSLHFGDLVDKLSHMGHKIALMPVVLRDVGYRNALEQVKSPNNPLMVQHRYLRFVDLIKAILATLSKPDLNQPFPKLHGMDIGPMAHEDQWSHWRSNRAADCLLFSAMIRRLTDAGANLTRIIYLYENQPWERALCWEAARSLPNAAMVGYQHARVPRNLLNLFQAEGGEKAAPFPNFVVTNGPYSARVLTSGGFEDDRVKVGCAIQMESLLTFRAETTARNSTPPRPVVLVASSEEEVEATELIEKAIDLYDPQEGVDIILKCHPIMPISKMTKFSDKPFPPHVNVSETPIIDLFTISSMMIYTGSTVSVQALAMGLPVIHLRPQFDFDLDPLEGYNESHLIATGVEDLRSKVDWLIENRHEYVKEHTATWDTIVDDLYGAVTDDAVRVFVS